MSLRVRRALLPCVVLSLASAARADVLVVDPSGAGGAFTQLQAAVDAASDGDVILVKSGTYDAVTIGDVSLTVQADTGADAKVRNGFVIDGLSAGRSVTLVGLANIVHHTALPPGIHVRDCAGPVVLEQCSLTGDFPILGLENPAALVEGSAAVTFSRCTLAGKAGLNAIEEWESASNGSDGLLVRDSMVAVEDCTVTGGIGGSWDHAEPLNGERGGDGVEVESGQVWIVASDLSGARGGFGDCDFFSCGSDGPDGAGLRITTAAASVTLRGTVVEAPDGSQPIVNSGGGALMTDPLAARLLHTTSPAREGETAELALRGQAGDLVSLFVSLSPGFVPMPARGGVFHLGFPLALPTALFVGALPGIGALQLDLVVPDLPPGLDALPLHVQSVFDDAQPGVVLGTPGVMVLLDGAL